MRCEGLAMSGTVMAVLNLPCRNIWKSEKKYQYLQKRFYGFAEHWVGRFLSTFSFI